MTVMSEELGLILQMVLRSVKISNGHDDLRCGLHKLYLVRTGISLYQWALDNSVQVLRIEAHRAFVGNPLPAKNPVVTQFALLAIGVPTYEMNPAFLLSSCSA